MFDKDAVCDPPQIEDGARAMLIVPAERVNAYQVICNQYSPDFVVQLWEANEYAFKTSDSSFSSVGCGRIVLNIVGGDASLETFTDLAANESCLDQVARDSFVGAA